MPLKVGMTKSEIEKEISGKGQYIQIDWLNRFLREPLTMEMKKFAYQKLADIYEKAGMFKEAAKMYDNMANFAITFTEKIKHYMKSVEMFVKGGDVFGADEAMKKAVSNANTRESADIYSQTMKFMKAQAEVFEQTNKRANAVQMYEKMLQMRVTSSEREDVKKRLQVLYEKLGKIKELRNLQGVPSVSSSRPEVKPQTRQAVPGALRDPTNTGATRERPASTPRSQRPQGQVRQDSAQPRRDTDLDIDFY